MGIGRLRDMSPWSCRHDLRLCVYFFFLVNGAAK
nr:MAG TPA: hypothetical protein [Caudoviricetes sp.]